MFCTYCGKKVEENVYFCPYCGGRAKTVHAQNGYTAVNSQMQGKAQTQGNVQNPNAYANANQGGYAQMQGTVQNPNAYANTNQGGYAQMQGMAQNQNIYPNGYPQTYMGQNQQMQPGYGPAPSYGYPTNYGVPIPVNAGAKNTMGRDALMVVVTDVLVAVGAFVICQFI